MWQGWPSSLQVLDSQILLRPHVAERALWDLHYKDMNLSLEGSNLMIYHLSKAF